MDRGAHQSPGRSVRCGDLSSYCDYSQDDQNDRRPSGLGRVNFRTRATANQDAHMLMVSNALTVREIELYAFVELKAFRSNITPCTCLLDRQSTASTKRLTIVSSTVSCLIQSPALARGLGLDRALFVHAARLPDGCKLHAGAGLYSVEDQPLRGCLQLKDGTRFRSRISAVSEATFLPDITAQIG